MSVGQSVSDIPIPHTALLPLAGQGPARTLYCFDLAEDFPLLGGVADASASLSALLAALPGANPVSVKALARRLPGLQRADLAERERCMAHWLRDRDPYSILFFPNFHSPLQRTPGQQGPRVVNLIHDLQYLHLPQHFSAARRQWLHTQFAAAGQRADLLLFVSQATYHDYLTHFPAPRRAAVIAHPIAQRRPAHLNIQRPYLLTCAHYAFHPHKNFTGTLALFADLARHPASVPGLELHLTGHGRDAFEREVLATLPAGLRQRVVHHGHVSGTRLERLHRGARAYLSLSHFEGFNLPAAQAANHGLPLLLSDLPVHRELHPQALHIDLHAADLASILAFIRTPRHIPWPNAGGSHPAQVAMRYASALAPLWRNDD